jgi:ABC-2 type transport system permease protein
MDGSGVIMLSNLSMVFFSGMLLPLNVFPGALGAVARLLPWSALLQVPADIFLGVRTGAGVVTALAFQICWAVILLGAGRALQSVATRKVVVQGG